MHGKSTSSEAIFFTDANTHYHPSTFPNLYYHFLKYRSLISARLVHINSHQFPAHIFSNPAVFKIAALADSAVDRSTNTFIRKFENIFGVSFGVNGSLYVVPSSFFRVSIIKHERIQNDDFFLGVLASKSFGFFFASDSYCFESVNLSLSQIFRSKFRDARGHFSTSLALLNYPLHPIQYLGIFARLCLWNLPLISFIFCILLSPPLFSYLFFFGFPFLFLCIFYNRKLIVLLAAQLGFLYGMFFGPLVKW